MTEHAPLPWAIRPQKFDDWGFIRGADGSIACCAKGEDSSTWDKHREAKTDPYQANADLIVKAVNNHEPMVAELKRLFELYGHQATADVLASISGRGGRE